MMVVYDDDRAGDRLSGQQRLRLDERFSYEIAQRLGTVSVSLLPDQGIETLHQLFRHRDAETDQPFLFPLFGVFQPHPRLCHIRLFQMQ